MVFDPFMIVMLALIGVMIFFMFRNGKKRQQAMQELQNNMRPGVEVMLQSGIYGTLEDVDDENNRVTLRSGTSTFVVHKNAVAQVLTANEEVDEPADLAPDDDPEFGERIAEANDAAGEANEDSTPNTEGDSPKA